MKKLIIPLFLCLLATTSYAQDKLAGTWNTAKQNTLVKIEKAEDAYTGKIISSDDEEIKAGTVIMKDVTLKKGKWEGKMYAPKRNEWYNAEFIPQNNTLTITVTVGFFSKTVEWTRKKV